MSMIEKVKKVLGNAVSVERIHIEGRKQIALLSIDQIETLAGEICQFFPKSVDNPDGYELKPINTELLKEGYMEMPKRQPDSKETPHNESRLLDKQTIAQCYCAGLWDIDKLLTLQCAKDQEFGQARVERLFKKIESHKLIEQGSLVDYPLKTSLWWQDLKKQEGIKDGS